MHSFLLFLAVLVTGIGGNFILGVDYTILANEGSADKQRKRAEALANGIKKLIKQVRRTSALLDTGYKVVNSLLPLLSS